MQLEVLPLCPVKDKAVLQGYFNAMNYMCYDTFEGTYHQIPRQALVHFGKIVSDAALKGKKYHVSIPVVCAYT